MKIKNKYFKAIALLSAAFVAGAVFVTYQGYKEAIEVTKRHFGDHHILMAEQASIGIEKNIHAMIRLLSVLSEERAIRDMDIEKSRILFKKTYEHARVHSVNDIALMDSAGIVRLALNAPYLEGKDFSFREYYQKAKELKTSTPVYEHVEFKGVDTGKKGIVIAVPVLSGEKRFGGLVLFAVKVEKFLEDLLSGQEGSDKTWVMDGGGNILYHPDYPPGTNVAELTDGSESFRAFVADMMTDGHSHSEYISPEGIATTAACYPLSVAGQTWEIVVSSPAEEFTGIVAQSSKKYGIGILLLVIASASIALTLKAYNNALEKAHDELEARVQERTADLAVAEEELRSVYNAISGHLTVISPDYRILSYNETVEKQFGGGLKGRLCYEAYQARDAVCPDCAVKQTLETKKPAYTYQPATSLSKSVEIYTYPIFDDKGNVLAVVEHGVELAERTELEENYHRQRMLLNTVFETTPDIMYIKDKEGKYVIVNGAFEKIMGVSCEEAVGKTMEDILPGEFAAESRASDLRVLEGETYHKEQRAITDGQEIIIDTIKMPLRDKDGAIYGIVGISRDITERRRAEESRRLLLKAVESLTVGVTISDADGKILYTNPAEARMHGYEVQELVGMDVNRLAPSELWKKIELAERGIAFSRESLNVRKDGAVFPVHLTSVRVEDENGAPFSIITVCEDITERKKAEEALRSSEERYRALIENIAVGIAVISPRMEIVSVNSKMQEWFPDIDFSKKPICYKSINHPRRDGVCSYCPTAKTLQDGEIHTAIADTPAGDEIRHYNIVSSPLRNENGEIIAAIEMVEDITERQRAAEELRAAKVTAEEERAKTEAIIACIGDGISIQDRDFMILYQNEAHGGMMGRHVGDYCYKAYQGRDHICEGCPMAKAFEDGGIHMVERSAVVNNRTVHVSIAVSVLKDIEGNIVAGIEVVRDITERKQAEEELAYNQLFLKSIIENEPECVKLLDAEGTLVDMNASGLKMIDAESLEQVKGKNVYGLVAPEHREAFKSHVEKVCQGEKSMLEFRAIGLKGRSIWLKTHAVPFSDAREKRTLLLAVTRDVTKRKQAEDEIKEINARLQTLFDTIPGAVFFKDAENRILVVNKGIEELSGMKADEMIGKTAEELLPHHAVEQCYRSDEEVIRSRSIVRTEEYVHGKTVETIKSPLFDDDGKYKGMAVLAFDITKRKEAEEALRRSEAELKKAQAVASIGSWHLDIAENVLRWSEETHRIFGVPKGTPLTYESFLERVHPDDRGLIDAAWKAALKGKPYDMEHRITVDGREKWIREQGEIRFDEDGTAVEALGTAHDITGRKRAEEALRKSEERYRGLFDSARDAIIIADADSGLIVSANRQAEKLLGRPASKIIGMHQADLHPKEERETYGSAFKEAVMEGRAVSPDPGGDIYVVNKRGEKIPVEISANVIKLEGKRLLQGIFRDITGRRAAERAAKEGQQYLENVLNSIQDGICILDLDYNVVKVNPTIEKWYAHRAPLTGKKCYEVFKGSSEICEHCPCSKVIVKGESCTETIPYLGPEGPSGTMELHAFPLLDPETGKAKGVIKYFRDITDKVALEAEAFRAAQLASVGELAAGVAHEINNPINGIINYAQLLVNRLPARSEESSISRRIIKEGDRISGIVSALLAFTREDALMEEPVDIEDLVLEALSLTIAQMAKDGIDVRINIPEDMPKVNMKRQHLEQVFLNIINNARHALNMKYPERHPEKALEISGESMVAEDIPHIRISFTDWGTGIAPDIIDRVTEPFFTTKQKGSGTGLGLSISSSIIKNSGGTLSIKSVEGEYTKVIIELPAGGA